MHERAFATPPCRDELEGVLTALPQLAREQMIPEINAIAVGPDGRLVVRGRRPGMILTYEHAGRRITGRFSRAGPGPVVLELGCRLVRLPYTAEARARRRELVRRIAAFGRAGPGQLAVTPGQWLYLHDRLRLDPAPFTASWLVTQLTLATLILSAPIRLFAELDETAGPPGVHPALTPREYAPSPDATAGRAPGGGHRGSRPRQA